MLGRGLAVTADDVYELTDEERATAEEDVVDAASAARTLEELGLEIRILADLEEIARRVRLSGEDKKWTELRHLLLDEESMYDTDGPRRKIIVFTEHRDTLNYLVDQIRQPWPTGSSGSSTPPTPPPTSHPPPGVRVLASVARRVAPTPQVVVGEVLVELVMSPDCPAALVAVLDESARRPGRAPRPASAPAAAPPARRTPG